MRWFLPLLLGLSAPALAQEARESTPLEAVTAEHPLPPVPAGWETVHGPFVRVHGAPDDLPTLLRLSNEAEKALPQLARDLGVPLGSSVEIYVADSDARFRALQPGQAPMWADGVAYPALGLVILRAPDVRGTAGEPLETVLRHELVHVLLGHAFLPTRPPTWLQEGLAQVHAGEVGPETTKTLANGLATGNTLSLTGLSRGFPADPVKARVAYAQSADLIGYLHDTYGPGSVRTLIRELSAGTSVEGAIHAATGEFIETIDHDWRQRLEGSGLAWGALANADLGMGLGGLLLIVGGISRRRAFHRRLEAMGEEEAALEALIASYLAMGRTPAR
ncbi:MAG: hypothetical protein KC656_04160 [Myxococcales bacterium]|nr:hypothetical protein [Myxococcales bacterium]